MSRASPREELAGVGTGGGGGGGRSSDATVADATAAVTVVAAATASAARAGRVMAVVTVPEAEHRITTLDSRRASGHRARA